MNQVSQTGTSEGVKNVVLVHGGFVDGSGWQGVYDLLRKDGYNVSIVQNPTTSLADDVAVTKRTLAAQNGPAILVGHSYGGVVITEAGNDPKVAGLVYVAAFAPDKGESVSALIQNPRLAPPSLQSCRRRTGTSSSTGRSSASRSRRTSRRMPPLSWPIPKFRGASRHSTAQSAHRHGGRSRAGTSCRPKTR
jgi:pimeloyl-ACP methyl ester carboxylesterase